MFLKNLWNEFFTISGVILGNYEFKIGNTDKQFSPKKVTLVSPVKLISDEVQSEISLAEATNFTRNLVNTPSNIMTPSVIASTANSIVK